MNRVFGLETEYGITVNGAETVDVVAESIELVRRYTDHGAHMKWDYELEDPHLDARGFRAKALMQDTDESAYYEIDKNRPLSFEEIKSDLVLSNGARFYNDHAHPEYSTPECTTLRQIVTQDKAGERILAECARRRNLKLPKGQEVRLYKNNTDFFGHSYGCHDNYLMQRGQAPQLEIAQPVDANNSISRDPNYDWIIELKDGSKISAIEVQRIYLRAAAKVDPPSPGSGAAGNFADEDRQWILQEWENVLNDLERDVMITRDRVDWAAKKFLLNALQEEEKLSWSDPWLQSIDLEYHNVDLESGLYYELARQGSVRRLAKEEEIKTATFAPPETTRAFFRGRSVARFNDQIASIQWDELVFANGALSRRVSLPEAFADARLELLNQAARNGKDFSEFIHAISAID